MATDSNRRDGYIYIVHTDRAVFNDQNTKMATLPNGEQFKEDENLVPLLITRGEIVEAHKVKKV